MIIFTPLLPLARFGRGLVLAFGASIIDFYPLSFNKMQEFVLKSKTIIKVIMECIVI
jgi:hypothetical protein